MRSSEDGNASTLAGATDGRLFALMRERSGEGREAWAEFYRRYVADFFRLMCRLRGLSNAGVEELVQETMVQVYKSAHTFREAEGLEPEGARRRTLAWLGRIARNIHYETLRGQKITLVSNSELRPADDGAAQDEPKIVRHELHHKIQEAEDVVAGGRRQAEGGQSSPRRLLREALATLPERELDVLLVTYDYHEKGDVQPYLPRSVVAELCERHGVSPAYLRKIRERARKQVVDYIETNSSAGKTRLGR